MSMLVWVMMGIAIWHFTVFVPDRFWGGIVGAFIVAMLGAVIFGFLVNGLTVPGQNDTDIAAGADRRPGRRDRARGVVAVRVAPRARAPATRLAAARRPAFHPARDQHRMDARLPRTLEL